MPYYGHENYHEIEREPPEPEPDTCQLGISPRCTDEAAYLYEGQYVCAHCFSAAEKALESGGIVALREQVVRR